MNKLSQRKSRLVCETEDTIRERGRHRAIVIELRCSYASMRLKGMRSAFEISYDSIYRQAVAIAVERRRREKLAKRKARR